MVTKFVENTEKNAMFIGGKMILPGEIREVECAAPVADAPAEKTAAELQAERLGVILAGNVACITASLPALDKSALAGLQALEQAGVARKGVLQAIDAALLTLASAVVPQ